MQDDDDEGSRDEGYGRLDGYGVNDTDDEDLFGTDSEGEADAQLPAVDLSQGLSAPPPAPVPEWVAGKAPLGSRGERRLASLTSDGPPAKAWGASARAPLPRPPLPSAPAFGSDASLMVRSNLPMVRTRMLPNIGHRIATAMKQAQGSRRLVPLLLSAERNPGHVSCSAEHALSEGTDRTGLVRAGYAPPTDTTPYPETWQHACWWCTFSFETRPVGCPTRLDTIRNIYYVTGMFCSYNCARAWGALNMPAHTRDFIGMWILSIVRAQLRAAGEVVDITRYSCEPAPAPSVLKRFGGYMEIEDFRRVHCQQTRLTCIPQALAIVPLGVNIFATPRDPKRLFVAPDESANKEEELRGTETHAQAIATAKEASQRTQKRKLPAESGSAKARAPKKRAAASQARMDAYRARPQPVMGSGQRQLAQRLERENNPKEDAWNHTRAQRKDAQSGAQPRANSALVMQRATPHARSVTSIQALMGLRFKTEKEEAGPTAEVAAKGKGPATTAERSSGGNAKSSKKLAPSARLGPKK